MSKLVLRSLVVAGGLACALAGANALSHGHDHGQAHAAMAGHGPAAHAGVSAAGLPVSETVSATQCWIRMLPAPAPSGGFFILRNAGDQDAVVEGASSPDYGMVMVHQTTQDQGMSKMAMVHEVRIPAGQDLSFKPGSYHVMLEQPVRPLAVGDHIHLDLALAGGQRVGVTCEIKPATALSY
jgi:copper(I)-binding protein